MYHRIRLLRSAVPYYTCVRRRIGVGALYRLQVCAYVFALKCGGRHRAVDFERLTIKIRITVDTEPVRAYNMLCCTHALKTVLLRRAGRKK